MSKHLLFIFLFLFILKWIHYRIIHVYGMAVTCIKLWIKILDTILIKISRWQNKLCFLIYSFALLYCLHRVVFFFLTWHSFEPSFSLLFLYLLPIRFGASHSRIIYNPKDIYINEPTNLTKRRANFI